MVVTNCLSRGPKKRSSRARRIRPLTSIRGERLEDRQLLAGTDLSSLSSSSLSQTMWQRSDSGDDGLYSFFVARLDGLSGTVEQQIVEAQIRLLDAGVSNTELAGSLGSEGLYLLRTTEEVSRASLNEDLARVPGYKYLQGAEGDPQTGSLIGVYKGKLEVNPLSRLTSTRLNAGLLEPAYGVKSLASPPTVLDTFEGLNANDNPFLLSPPDPILAAGPEHVVEAVNNALRFYSKDGTVLATQSLDDFYAPLGVPSAGDPLVVYDDMAGRWYIASIDGANNNNILLAVSNTSDPLDGFAEMHQVAITPPGDLADFPKMGFNADAVVIEVNDFGSVEGDPRLTAIDKATLLDANSATYTAYNSTPAPNFRAMVPATMHGAAPGADVMYFVQERSFADGDFVQVVQMTGVLSDSPVFNYYDIDVDDYGFPPAAQQPGGLINTNDTTFLNADWRNGMLVATHSVGDFSDGDAHAAWYLFEAEDSASATPTLIQEGRLDPGDGISTYYPSVAITAGGTIGMTYMQSSPSQFASMYVTGRSPSDPPGTMSEGALVAEGEDFLDGFFRAGDYSGIAVDPVGGTTFWAANEYKAADAFWNTAIAHFSLGMAVTSTSPANGEIVATKPTEYIVDFSDPFDPSSINPAGVLVNGNPASAYDIVDDNTISFTFTVDPVSGQGLQQFDVAAGTVVRLSDGDPLQAYTSTFRYDVLRMEVVSTVPADGSVATLPLNTITVNLNEPYAASSVSTTDLTLSMGTVTEFNLVDADTINYLVSGINAEGTLNFSLRVGALTDVHGNPSLPYSASVALDYGTVPFPTPTTSVAPKGSMIYQTSIEGNILPTGDTDRFTILVDTGQTISVIVEPDDTLRPAVNLSGPGVGGNAKATAPGADAVIQTAGVPSQLGGSGTPKKYTVTVSGAGGTTGSYTVRLILNAAVEFENHDGPANDSLRSAQVLGESFIALDSGRFSPARAGVVGRVGGGALPGDVYVSNRSFNFFGGNVVRYDADGNLVQTIDSPEFERGIISDVELGPDNVIYVALTTNFFGGTVEGELLKFDTAGNFLGNVVLPDDPVNIGYFYPFGFDVATDGTFWVPQLNSGDLVHVGPGGNLLASYPLGLQPQDATVGADGQIYVSFIDFNVGVGKVLQVNPGTGSVSDFVPFSGFIPAGINATSDGGFWLGDILDGASKFESDGTVSRFVPEFFTLDPQQDPSDNLWIAAEFNGVAKYDAAGNFQFRQFPPGGDALGLAVLGTDSTDPLPRVDLVDYYAFDLGADSTATIAVDLLSGTPVTVELLDPWGNPIAAGTSSGSIEQVIDDFVAPFSGTYFVRITGNGSDYSLVVTRDATFDIGGNDAIATAQPIVSPEVGGRRTALGYVGAESVVLDYVDSGWWDGTGFHDEFNDNYIAGLLSGAEYRDYVVFDLAGLSGSVLDASLNLFNPAYVSPDPSETFTLFDVSTPISELTATGFGQTGIFDDLGTGVVLGSREVSSADDGSVVSIPLNAAGRQAISAAGGGLVALGGAITSLSADDEFIFGGSGDPRDVRQLAVSIEDSDYYKVNVAGNETIRLETDTPADEAGEFVNLLDPRLELYDSAGNLVAANDDGAPDLRNAKISYRVPSSAGGTYYIRVAREGDTKGEYILSVKGADVTPEAFTVESTVPPDGAQLYLPPSEITVSFNDQFDITTVKGADVKVDGVPGKGITIVDGDTAAFGTRFVYEYNGHYYTQTTGAKDWLSAQAEAKELGGNLVTVNDQAEQDFLKRVFFSDTNRDDLYWIGLNDIAQEGTFVWVSGEPVTYTNWAPGEPNDFPPGEDAVVINWIRDLNNGAWNDYFADQEVVGIIELSSLPSKAWVATEGTHTVSIDGGAIRDLQGTPVSPYSGTFTLDYTPPQVVSSSIQEGDILPAGALTYTVEFSEPLQTALVDPFDIGLFGQLRGGLYFPSSIEFDATGTVLTVHYEDLLDDQYTLTLFSDPFSFVDQVGLSLDGEPVAWPIPPNVSGDGVEGGDFFVNFATDLDTRALPTPLRPVQPLGSLVYGTNPDLPNTKGTIVSSDDTDEFTFELDAGQTASIVIGVPGGGLQPTVSLVYGSTVLGSATAPAVGEEAFLQTIPIANPGMYRIVVGSADGLGLYSVQLILNAAVEEEAHSGPTNDSLADAQSLSAAFIDLNAGADRAAVLGRLEQFRLVDTIYLADFESGQQGFTVDNAPPDPFYLEGLWHLSTGRGEEPGHSASTSFYYGQGEGPDGGGTYALGEFTPTAGSITSPPIPLPADTIVVANFSHVLQTRVSPGDVDFAALEVNDGSGWTTLQRYDRDAESSVWTTTDLVDLSSYAGQTVQLRWSFDTRRGPVGRVPEGWYIDDVRVSEGILNDYYSFELQAGDSATIALNSLNDADVEVTLVGPDGASLARGSEGLATNVDESISGFFASAAGTYYLRVTGDAGAEYNLLVTRNAEFDLEDNGTIESAQPILSSPTAGTQSILGFAGGAPGALYGASPSGELITIDIATGTGTLVGFPGGTTEIEYNNDTGRAFGQLPDGAFAGQEFDIETGAPIGDVIFNGGAYNGLEWVGDTLYGTAIFGPGGPSELRTLNPWTGESQFIGSTGVGPVSGLAYDEATGVMYGIAGGGQSSSELYTIDLTTGAATTIGTTGFRAGSLEFGPDGVLYGGGGGQDLGNLYRINPATAEAALVGNTGFGTLSGLALRAGQISGDFFEITLSLGTPLEVESFTPADGSGEFVNLLDPLIRLYDAAGNLVASDDNSAADGRNAKLSYQVPPGAAGTYFIEVGPSDATEKPTRGEYILAVKGGTSEFPPFEVTATDPSDGARVRGATTQITVDFNDTILLTSLDASDLTVNGVSATGLTVVDGNTVDFQLPALTEGNQTVQIAAGAIQDVQGTPLEAFAMTFFEDLTPPRVVSSSIQEGDVLPSGDLTYTVAFSEPLQTSLVDIFDFGLFGQLRGTSYFPTSFQFNATGTMLTVNYQNLLDDQYTLTLFSNPFSFVDESGFFLDGEPLVWPIPPNQSGNGIEGGDFFVDFVMDAGTQALPVPLVAIDPLGSLVYQSPFNATGVIAFAGDTDDFTINLDAGQTVTVLVAGLSRGLTVELNVDGPGGSIGTATAPAPGGTALLQTATVSDAGTYTLQIGSASGLGLYSVRLILNAAAEEERNDSVADAQSLAPSFIDLGSGMSRGAVVGTSDGAGGYAASAAPFEFTDISGTGIPTLEGVDDDAWFLGEFDLNGFAFPFYGQTYTSLYFSSNGLITLDGFNADFSNTDLTTFPNEASIAVLWDDLVTIEAPGAVYWEVLGAGDTQQLVIQWQDVAYISDLSLFITFQAILSEADGSIRFNYLDLDGSPFQNEGSSATVGLKNTGPQGPDRLVLAFDNGPNEFVGSGQSTLIQTVPPSEDYYSVDLAASQPATIVLADLVDAGVEFELLDSAETVLATGTGGVISNFEVPANGTYYIRVFGDVRHDYNLVVSVDAAFDTEPNDTQDTAQPLAGNKGALGAIVNAAVATVGTSFEGIDANGSNCGCLPPDTNAAVGNDYVVETVNAQIRVFDKTTGNVLFDEPLASFFGDFSGGDSYVVYDDIADRWYVSAFDSTNSGLFLAVSVDGNPLHGFLPTYHLTDVGDLPDYQKLGFNRDAIFISYNDFGTSGGDAAVASIDKTAALTGTLTYYVSHPTFQFRAMPPAQMHGDTTGGVEWFVSTDGTDAGGNTIRVTALTNYLSNSPIFTYTSLPVTPYQAPFRADQPGGDVTVFPNTTTTQVQYRNGHLVTAMASGTAADGFVYPKGLYYQIDVSSGTPTLLQQGVIDPGMGVAVQMPSVDEDIHGNLGLSWIESSSSEYLSMWVGAVDSRGNFGSSVAAPGGGFFPASFRIGDYSTTVLDPSDGTTFWSANEYIGSDGDTNIWRTHIASFEVDFQADSDWYDVEVADGEALTLAATVPSGGPGEFVNDLIPRIELYDADGGLVDAVEGAGTALTTGPLAGGTYSVRLSSAGEAGGEYVLAVETSVVAPIAVASRAAVAPAYLPGGTNNDRVVASEDGVWTGDGDFDTSVLIYLLQRANDVDAAQSNLDSALAAGSTDDEDYDLRQLRQGEGVDVDDLVNSLYADDRLQLSAT